jgi:signal transduction histidine kinase
MKHPSLPKTLLDDESDEQLKHVNNLFKKGSLIGAAIWVFLLFLVLRYSPAESYEEPWGLEQTTHLIVCVVLCASNGSRIVPIFLRELNFRFMKSGFLASALSVQVIAIVSNFIMWYVPSPVLVDEYSGLRFHMVRWAEWTALAFIMTFLTCNLNATSGSEQGKVNFVYPTLLALSTLCGMLFPLCHDATSWWIVMTFAWLSFNAIYVLVYRRRKTYAFHQKTIENTTNSSPHEANIDLSRSAYNLALACASTWTMLSVVFTFMCFTNKVAPPESWLNHPANPVIFTATFEVASKVIYLGCVFDTYDKVFDEKAIALRRLEEMRNFMCAVWTSSSDAIVYVLDGNDHISARISPAFLRLIGVASGRACSLLRRGDVSLIIDISPSKGIFHVFAMDLTKEVTREDVTNALNAKKLVFEQKEDLTIDEANIVGVAELILHETKVPGRTMKVFHKIENDLKVSIPCEATVADLEGNSRVVVLRDISDRLQRFEAEKLLIEEVTSRKKDTEANNFTRHEVKNGILASIGILDHIRELMPQVTVPKGASEPFVEGSSQKDQVTDALTELDSTLRDILDTIHDEAMAKEIIYGEYAPRKDVLRVRDVLDSIRQCGASKRFPLHIKPHFPRVYLDRQLLRYIYRNALSNACRYGQHGGTVESFVHYDQGTRIFTLKVTNLPGEGHEELLELDDDQVRSIFEPGVRLAQNHHPSAKNAQAINKESSGNGAWIMQKCAECLGGSCSMQFDENGATFTFVCTIDAEERPSPTSKTTFCLPAGTWGIFIDDSGIQRKLMDRFLAQAGIEQSRRVILGANADEVYCFVDTVIKLVSENPNDKFLLIADENLDIEFDGQRNATVSGSLCVEQIIGKLDEKSEKRLLALIRSANDSLSDLNLYRNRSHGVLMKEPFKKGDVLGIIKPFWYNRFSEEETTDTAESAIYEGSDEFQLHGPSEEDLRESLRVIRALLSVENNEKLRRRWHPLRDRLHALKGDLMSMMAKDKLADVMKHIDKFLACSVFPESFLIDWEAVEQIVEYALAESP